MYFRKSVTSKRSSLDFNRSRRSQRVLTTIIMTNAIFFLLFTFLKLFVFSKSALSITQDRFQHDFQRSSKQYDVRQKSFVARRRIITILLNLNFSFPLIYLSVTLNFYNSQKFNRLNLIRFYHKSLYSNVFTLFFTPVFRISFSRRVWAFENSFQRNMLSPNVLEKLRS